MVVSKVVLYLSPYKLLVGFPLLQVFKKIDEYYISPSRSILTFDGMFCSIINRSQISDGKKMTATAGLMHTYELKVWLGTLKGVCSQAGHGCGWDCGTSKKWEEAVPMWIG